MATIERQEDFDWEQITPDRVTYARLANTGNYENERIEVSAAISEGQNPLSVLNKLKEFVNSQLHSQNEYELLDRKFYKLRTEIKDHQEKIEQHKKLWLQVQQFWANQNLNTDQEFPTIPDTDTEQKQLSESSTYSETVDDDVNDGPF